MQDGIGRSTTCAEHAYRIAQPGIAYQLGRSDTAENRGNRYLFEVNSKWTIDGKSRRNIARYFNHSCNPNADSTIRGKRVFVYTLRAIKPGEEITYNYGSDYLKNVIGKSNCQCSRCRKRRAKRAAELRVARKRKAARAARTGSKR